MADIQKAVSFVIALEDTKPSGLISQLRGDSGGRTRYGIAQRWHPDLEGFFDGDPLPSTNPQLWKPTTVDEEKGRAIAGKIYADEYAAPLQLDKIKSQDVANRMMSFGVNEGIHQSVVLLQRALGFAQAAQDGRVGPQTVSAVNAIDPDALWGLLRIHHADFYARLGAARPELAQYANGLKNRANA